MDASPSYRERLVPSWWMYVALLLVVPALLLVFLPIDRTLGAIAAGVLYLGAVLALWLGAPRVEVAGGTLRAGRATIDASLLGEPEALAGPEARLAMGRGWEASAHHITVPWTRGLVRVPVLDEADPTTAWVMSSRRPAALANAIRAAR